VKNDGNQVEFAWCGSKEQQEQNELEHAIPNKYNEDNLQRP
jgi:hypothetical protein